MTHNKIIKVLVNDNGTKIEYNWVEFEEKYPSKYPHFSISFVKGNSNDHKTLYVETYETQILLYNLQEDSFYYVLGNSPFNMQFIPHNHPAIIPSIEQGLEYINKEYQKHEGEITVIYKDKNGQMRLKFIGK